MNGGVTYLMTREMLNKNTVWISQMKSGEGLVSYVAEQTALWPTDQGHVSHKEHRRAERFGYMCC